MSETIEEVKQVLGQTLQIESRVPAFDAGTNHYAIYGFDGTEWLSWTIEGWNADDTELVGGINPNEGLPPGADDSAPRARKGLYPAIPLAPDFIHFRSRRRGQTGHLALLQPFEQPYQGVQVSVLLERTLPEGVFDLFAWRSERQMRLESRSTFRHRVLARHT